MFFLNSLSYPIWKSKFDRSPSEQPSSEQPWMPSREDALISPRDGAPSSSPHQVIEKLEQVHQRYSLERRTFL